MAAFKAVLRGFVYFVVYLFCAKCLIIVDKGMVSEYQVFIIWSFICTIALLIEILYKMDSK